MEKIHREAEVQHFSQNFHEFTGLKTIFAFSLAFFSPKIGEKKKICQNPFQAIIRLIKRRKKVAWTTKPLV